jgi:hypothetical protein
MSQLDREEFPNWKSQFVISSWGGLRRATPTDLAQKIQARERKCKEDAEIQVIFPALKKLLSPSPPPPQRRIAFAVEMAGTGMAGGSLRPSYFALPASSCGKLLTCSIVEIS